MAQKIVAKFIGSQKDFNSVAKTAWRNFLLYLTSFTAHKAFYKTETAENALIELNKAAKMPDVKQRNEKSEKARTELIPLAAKCTDLFVLLKTYIDSAYDEDVWDIMYNSAGQPYFDGSINKDWDSVSFLCGSMITFIATHDTELEAGENMPVAFIDKVNNAADAFNKKYEDYKEFSETGVATQEKLKALNACYKTLTSMMKDGKAIFRNDAAILELFIYSNIMAAINPTKAAIMGLVTDVATDEAIENATISVKYANEPAIVLKADSDGIFSDEMKGGTATIIVSAPNYIPKTEVVDIQTGTTLRQNVKLERAA